MYRWYYDGPVKEFDFCVTEHWKATTLAPSEAKARCNLAYRYKKEHGLKVTSKVSIPGKLVKEDIPKEEVRVEHRQLSFKDVYGITI